MTAQPSAPPRSPTAAILEALSRADQLTIAKALESRGNCATPLATLMDLTGFDREKVKRVTRDMANRERIRGLLVDSIELTETGRKWLEEVRFG